MLTEHLDKRGWLTKSITRPAQMYPVGLLFGIGFDTATEVLTVTGLSVAVALVIGSIELIGVAHDRLGFVNPVTDWISDLDLNNVGFVIVAAFVVVWAVAIAYWKIARVEHRWRTPEADQA